MRLLDEPQSFDVADLSIEFLVNFACLPPKAELKVGACRTNECSDHQYVQVSWFGTNLSVKSGTNSKCCTSHTGWQNHHN
jgi:hypothetical protein